MASLEFSANHRGRGLRLTHQFPLRNRFTRPATPNCRNPAGVPLFGATQADRSNTFYGAGREATAVAKGYVSIDLGCASLGTPGGIPIAGGRRCEDWALGGGNAAGPGAAASRGYSQRERLEFRQFPGGWPVRSADAPAIQSRFSWASSLRGIGLGSKGGGSPGSRIAAAAPLNYEFAMYSTPRC